MLRSRARNSRFSPFCTLPAALIAASLALLAPRAHAQRAVPAFDRQGRQTGEKVYDPHGRLARETIRVYRSDGQPESDTTIEYAADGSRSETRIQYAPAAPGARPAGSPKASEPEIRSETLTDYNRAGKPTSEIRTEYQRGKKTRAIEFQRDANGALFDERTTLYRQDGERVREETFDAYYADVDPPVLRSRVRTLQDEHGRTVLISNEHYANIVAARPKLVSGTRQVFEYPTAKATQPSREITSKYDPQRGEWQPGIAQALPMGGRAPMDAARDAAGPKATGKQD